MTTQLQNKITDAEWEIMRIVWANKKATSKEIIAILADKIGWKQATVKTLIGRLVDKGYLNTEAEGNKFIYSAAVSETNGVASAADDLLNRICHKKIGTTLGQLIEQATLSHDDVRNLEEIIAQKKQTAVEEVQCQCVPGQCDCNLKTHDHH